MNKAFKIVMLLLVIIICVSFFLPWVDVQSKVAGNISKFFTNSKQSSLKTISGFQVPILANGPDAKLMIMIVKIFNPAVTDAHKKSWLIWSIPGLAVVLFLLVLFLDKNKWVNLGIGILGVSIFSGVTFKLLTTNMDKTVLNVVIGHGLWILLFAYLGIGIINLLAFCKLNFCKNK